MNAGQLRALAGIQRRGAGETGARTLETGIQRQHDTKRSAEIARFVENGYPWSDISEAVRTRADYADLRKPGWLPTAIVVNFLTQHDRRQGLRVGPADRVRVSDDRDSDGLVEIELPEGFDSSWTCNGLKPLEVIDGQHRLWSFEEHARAEFELPVVAFVGLDISWQAYLFWTINIKPTRINPSLAFDLYPLLRAEDWLERFEGPVVYRQTRAQELVEFMWAHSASPWHNRINMLGERGVGGVSQASWIRNLTATLVRRAETTPRKIGGLFGAPSKSDKLLVPWNRTQQAAFLIHAWGSLEMHIAIGKEDWMLFLRTAADDERPSEARPDPAFSGKESYLNQDQGVRAFLAVLNDMVLRADGLQLEDWSPSPASDDPLETISADLDALKSEPVAGFVDRMTRSLARFDWRSANAPGLVNDEALRTLKSAFRGTGGYALFRLNLLQHLARDGDDEMKRIANTVLLLERKRR